MITCPCGCKSDHCCYENATTRPVEHQPKSGEGEVGYRFERTECSRCCRFLSDGGVRPLMSAA